MYDHPVQCTCRPAKPTPVQKYKNCGLPTLGGGNPTPSDQF